VTPPDHNRSKFRNRFPAGQKPLRNEGPNRASRERGSGGAMAKYTRYLELAQQAKVAGDEVAVQHNLQHAEHWYPTARADPRTQQFSFWRPDKIGDSGQDGFLIQDRDGDAVPPSELAAAVL
jgi:hypothetical protein